MPPKLVLDNVTVERQTFVDGKIRTLRIVSGVNVSVPTAGRLVILGPSGAGKTSVLRVCNRLDDPASGRILLDGIDVSTLEPTALRRRVAMVFQQPFLFDATVKENLAYPLQLLHHELSHQQAVSLLAEVGLPEDILLRRGSQLSGGQQQRVALARALSLDPEVLLLDEPTSALDEESARLLIDALLHRNRKRGVTLLVVTHAREMMQRLDAAALYVHDGAADYYSTLAAALSIATLAQME